MSIMEEKMGELKMCPYCKQNRGTHHKGYCSEYCRDMADITNRLNEAVKEIDKMIEINRNGYNSEEYQTGLWQAKSVLMSYFPELKEGKMITEKRLQELIDLLTTAVNNDYPDPLGEENADNLIALLELKTLRKAIKQQGSILDSREELITKLIKGGDCMAQILSDGAMPADEICCVDYFHARDAVYKHAELIEKL